MLRGRWKSAISRTLVLLLSLVWSFIWIGGSSASAVVTGRSLGSQSITAAAWAVVANGRNQPVTRTPYVLVWSVTGGTAYDYLQFRNIGTIPIQGFGVTITQVRLTGNANPREIFFERCNGGSWNVVNHSCSGSISELGTATSGLLTFANLSIGVGSFLEVRARTRPNAQSTFQTTLATQVTRAHIRLAETSNS